MTRLTRRDNNNISNSLDSDVARKVTYKHSESPPNDKASENEFQMFPWNDPLYKPETVISEDFWIEFMRAALILRYLHHNRTPKRRDFQNDQGYQYAYHRWVESEPDVYAVFNKLRQDFHDELPYRPSVIEKVDQQVEREVAKELKNLRNR